MFIRLPVPLITSLHFLGDRSPTQTLSVRKHLNLGIVSSETVLQLEYIICRSHWRN